MEIKGTDFKPEAMLHRISAEETYGHSAKDSIIHLCNLLVQLERPLRNVKLMVSRRNAQLNENGYTLIENQKKSGLFTSQKSFTWTTEDFGTGESSFEIGTQYDTCLHFDIVEIAGFSYWKEDRPVGSGSFDLKPALENPNNRQGGEINIQIPLVAKSGSTEGSLLVIGRFEAPVAKEMELQLERGDYETVVIPENIQTLWGPVDLKRLPPGTDNQCKVASHR